MKIEPAKSYVEYLMGAKNRELCDVLLFMFQKFDLMNNYITLDIIDCRGLCSFGFSYCPIESRKKLYMKIIWSNDKFGHSLMAT